MQLLHSRSLSNFNGSDDKRSLRRTSSGARMQIQMFIAYEGKVENKEKEPILAPLAPSQKTQTSRPTRLLLYKVNGTIERAVRQGRWSWGPIRDARLEQPSRRTPLTPYGIQNPRIQAMPAESSRCALCASLLILRQRGVSVRNRCRISLRVLLNDSEFGPRHQSEISRIQYYADPKNPRCSSADLVA